MINYGGHKLFGTAESEVTKVLQSDFLTQGPVVARFESKVDHFLHGLSCRSSRASVCVSSGSAALVGLLQCNAAFSSTAVTQSSVFLVPVNTYIATANAVLAAGYSIEYVDCDPLTGNVTAGNVELAVQRVLGGGRVVSGAIVTHIGGQAVDITEVRRSLPDGAMLFEDGAHAFGSKYSSGVYVGCSEDSNGCIFSFHPLKTITTAEGGAIVVGNKDWLRWIRAWRVNGLADFKADPFDPYTQVCVGSNYRMSDLHAALGVSQISNVEQILGHRKALATTYLERLKNIRGVKVAIDDEGVCNSSNHLFIVHFESSRERANVYRELIKKGVKASFHYKPIPLVTGQCSRLSAAFEGAESYHQRSMSLPIHLNMTAEDAIFITEIMVKALETRT